MQFGMLSGVGPGNMHYMGYGCRHGNGHFWSVWLIEKHCKAQDFRELDKRVSCAVDQCCVGQYVAVVCTVSC